MFNGKQTFITKLENNNSKMIDFERWSYKKVETVERKARELYISCNGLFIKKAIEKGAVKLSIYSTDATGSNEKLIKVIPVENL